MKTFEEIPENQIECIKACRKISNKFYEKEGWMWHNTFLECRLCQNSINVYLRFGAESIALHGSGDDRPYREETDTYQPWYSYLRDRLKEKKEELNCITF